MDRFIIYTKGFLNLHKYNKLKITKWGSRLWKFSHKNKQPIILNDRNLTPIKSSNRNDNKDIKLLTLSHKSRNSKLKSNKISIMVNFIFYSYILQYIYLINFKTHLFMTISRSQALMQKVVLSSQTFTHLHIIDSTCNFNLKEAITLEIVYCLH